MSRELRWLCNNISAENDRERYRAWKESVWTDELRDALAERDVAPIAFLDRAQRRWRQNPDEADAAVALHLMKVRA